jgi:hypothetical protein
MPIGISQSHSVGTPLPPLANLLQHLLELAPRVTGGMLCNLFSRSRDHDLAAFRVEIDDPIGATDHIEVVLSSRRSL